MPIEVSEIVVYPIKSLRGVSLPACDVEKQGLRGDRRMMLVGDDGAFLTQRKLRQLALFDTAFTDECIEVRLEGHGCCIVPPDATGSHLTVEVWKDMVDAVEVDPVISAWFSEALGQSCRLVRMAEGFHRPLFSREGLAEGPVSFADTNPILVASQESIDDLNSRLTDSIPIRRFRPNLVVKGCRPFEEDEWSSIAIGDVRLQKSMRCARCLVTTIDIETGGASDEPLRTLSEFRKNGTYVWFGSYYAPQVCGRVAVGHLLDIS
jgi:uncharacterized protein YcbX